MGTPSKFATRAAMGTQSQSDTRAGTNTTFKIISLNTGGWTRDIWHMCNFLVGIHEPDVLLIQEGCGGTKVVPITILGYHRHATEGYAKAHNVATYFRKETTEYTVIKSEAKLKHPIASYTVKRKNSDLNLTITNVYCTHDTPLDVTQLEEILEEHQNNIIAGDFNDNNNSNSTDGKARHAAIQKLLEDTSLKETNTSGIPTNHAHIVKSSMSQIDHILVEEHLLSELDTFTVLPGCEKTRNWHDPIAFTISTTCADERVPARSSRNLEKPAYQKTIKHLLESDRYRELPLETKTDIDAAGSQIANLIQEAQDICNPKKIPKRKDRGFKPTNYLQFLYKEKTELSRTIGGLRRIREQGKQYDTPALNDEIEEDTTYLTALREVISTTTEKEKTKRKVDIANGILKHEKFSREAWGTMNALAGNKTRPPSDAKLTYEGVTTTNTEAKAEMHRKYQEQVFQPIDTTSPDTELNIADMRNTIDALINEPPTSALEFVEVDMCELDVILSTISSHKAPGPDGISPCCYKWATTELKNRILKLFNACLRKGYTSKEWKEAVIILLPKQGKDTSKPDAYRPISLINTLAKLLDKIVCWRLRGGLVSAKKPAEVEEELCEEGDYITTDDPFLPASQAGFLPGRGCLEHLFCYRQYTVKNAHAGFNTITISADKKNAFDQLIHEKINHQAALLVRQEKLSMEMFNYQRNFLDGRTFRIRLGNHVTPNIGTITAGVPQGSCTGPVSYIMATADTPTVPRTREEIETDCMIWERRHTDFLNKEPPPLTALYADDDLVVINYNGTIENCTRNDVQIGTLRGHVTKWEDWALKNKMRFNPTKTQLLITKLGINESIYSPQVPFFGEQLQEQSTLKYLGVTFDEYMNMDIFVDEQIKRARKKINGVAWVIAGTDIPPMTAFTMMKALAFSVILYGSITWLGSKKHEVKVNKLLNYARKKACRLSKYESSSVVDLILPAPKMTLSEWCYEINSKWYKKAYPEAVVDTKDLYYIADPIERAQKGLETVKTCVNNTRKNYEKKMGGSKKESRNLPKSLMHSPAWVMEEYIATGYMAYANTEKNIQEIRRNEKKSWKARNPLVSSVDAV